jgi:hypothetical protein
MTVLKRTATNDRAFAHPQGGEGIADINFARSESMNTFAAFIFGLMIGSCLIIHFAMTKNCAVNKAEIKCVFNFKHNPTTIKGDKQ